MSSPLPLQRNLSHYLSPPFYFIFLFSLLLSFSFLFVCFFPSTSPSTHPFAYRISLSFLPSRLLPFHPSSPYPFLNTTFFFHATSFSLFHRTFLRYFSLYRIFLRKKPFSTAFDDPHLPHPSNEALPPSLPFFLSLSIFLRYFFDISTHFPFPRNISMRLGYFSLFISTKFTFTLVLVSLVPLSLSK